MTSVREMADVDGAFRGSQAREPDTQPHRGCRCRYGPLLLGGSHLKRLAVAIGF